MRIFSVILVLICLSLPYVAQAGAPAPISHQQSMQLVESYLKTLNTAKARFVQTAHDGTQLSGTFYLNRPGKLRFEYDPPVKDFIVADGYFLYFYDAELGEQSNAPIGMTLADFILRSDTDLRKDLSVADAKRGGGLLQIRLEHADEPGSGALLLGFEETPLTLKKWRVIDPQGYITEVALTDMQRNIPLDDELFIYRDPNRAVEFQRFND